MKNKKKKIAQIICTYPPYKGGIGNSAFNFGVQMKKAGFEVENLIPNYTNIQSEGNSKSGKIIRLKPWLKYGNAALTPQLLWKLKKYDVVYLHYPFFGGAELVWLFKIFNPKKRLIIHFHHDVLNLNPLAKILSLPAKLIEKSLFKKANIITCASFDYVKNSSIKNIYEEYKNKFVEVPFGVDLEKFKPNSNKKEEEAIKILFVGGLDKAHYFKGVEVLIEAVSKLENKNWELSIIGDGDLKPNYQEKAKKLNIAEKINFLGNISNTDLPKKYQEADIFVLPSINKGEAFGMVILEALASGVPVIASNLPGVRGVFQNGKQGLVCEPNNSENLKEKINQLLNNKNLRKQMRNEARILAEEKYSWERVKKQLIDILK